MSSSYDWHEGFWMTDGNCWCLGFNLGKCPKEPTGETVRIRCKSPIFWEANEKGKELELECQVYRVSTDQSFHWKQGMPVDWVYIALGEYRGWPMLFEDKNTLEKYGDFLERDCFIGRESHYGAVNV